MQPLNFYHEDPDEPEVPDINDDELDFDNMEARPTIAQINVTSQVEEAKRETSLDFNGKTKAKQNAEGLGIGKADDNISMISKDQKMCRICFLEEEDQNDPLISPCKCSGSMEFVHLNCLRHWLSRNENKKVAPHVTTYIWKAFHCELCKHKLEDHFVHNKQTHQIFEISKPQSNYLIVETF